MPLAQASTGARSHPVAAAQADEAPPHAACPCTAVLSAPPADHDRRSDQGEGETRVPVISAARRSHRGSGSGKPGHARHVPVEHRRGRARAGRRDPPQRQRAANERQRDGHEQRRAAGAREPPLAQSTSGPKSPAATAPPAVPMLASPNRASVPGPSSPTLDCSSIRLSADIQEGALAGSQRRQHARPRHHTTRRIGFAPRRRGGRASADQSVAAPGRRRCARLTDRAYTAQTPRRTTLARWSGSERKEGVPAARSTTTETCVASSRRSRTDRGGRMATPRQGDGWSPEQPLPSAQACLCKQWFDAGSQP
jgi:hypothetical protein